MKFMETEFVPLQFPKIILVEVDKHLKYYEIIVCGAKFLICVVHAVSWVACCVEELGKVTVTSFATTQVGPQILV